MTEEEFRTIKRIKTHSHDYAHCEGVHDGHTCPLREGCTRYAMHLDAAALGMEYVCYLIHDADISHGCTEYWALNTKNNDHDITQRQ